MGTGRTALRLLGTIALLHQRLGQAPGQLLAHLPHGPGHLLQGGFGLFHLRLQGVHPPIKALMQLLPKLDPLFLLAPLSQRDDYRSPGWLLSLPERAPHSWDPAANGFEILNIENPLINRKNRLMLPFRLSGCGRIQLLAGMLPLCS